MENENAKQYQQLLDTLMKLNVNIPLVDALVQISNYGKFMKELLSKKKKLSDMETTALTKGCSTILTNQLHPKMKDPGSFTIPCPIGNNYLGKALCDLGASINVMPLSTFKKLGIGHMKPTTVTLQLVDRSLGELTMRLNDEHITFSVFKSIQCNDKEECHIVDVLDDLIAEEFNDQSIILSEKFAMTFDDEFVDDCDSMVEANNIELRHGWQIESLDLANRTTPIFKPSIDEAPTLELKPLPTNLKYVFLSNKNTLPVIVSTTLDVTQEEKLVHIFKQHKRAIA
ncbi:uncharacterized protein LOC105795727 [Gossypium raimondii]|uniref:uncharacterized protein LOC105795727 n=1 Tax=Gossypium raimondii TaxID=29730 RepID=UPI00063A884A|nr:uncharacterized protein LOC105795727 [Gossypium raimondii]